MLAAAVLPGTGRDAAFRLHKESGPGGFAVETGNGGEVIGSLVLFNEQLVDALHVVERLVRSPEALANALEAAGPVALERAGAVLDERIPGAWTCRTHAKSRIWRNGSFRRAPVSFHWRR